MGAPEISVIIPAHGAQASFERAARSALESAGVAVEVVAIADDQAEYAPLLPAALRRRTQFLRTGAPRSGPSAARNLGLAAAQAPLLAYLDADDYYAPDRLARLAPLAREHGAAAGPCTPVSPSGPSAVAEEDLTDARFAGPWLALETIISARRSFSPVFDRRHAGPWRTLRFAEDMIFNAELHCRAPAYAYDPAALYAYVQTERSATRGAGSLERAIQGYGDILGQLFDLDLTAEARALLFRQMQTDLTDFGAAYFKGGADWMGRAQG